MASKLISQISVPRRSTPFAFIVPITRSATEALKLRANRPRCADSRTHAAYLRLQHRRIVAKLDFALLTGRRYISFGSSRASEFRLPPVKSVSACQFLISIDFPTARITIRDLSLSGTWILGDGEKEFRLLHHETVEVQSNMIIRVGNGDSEGLELRLIPAEIMQDTKALQMLIREHHRSIRGKDHYHDTGTKGGADNAVSPQSIRRDSAGLGSRLRMPEQPQIVACG